MNQTIRVQSCVDFMELATIAAWLLDEETEVTSISALIAQTVQVLAEVIVLNGHYKITDPKDAEAVLLQVTSHHSKIRKPSLACRLVKGE